MGAVSQKLRSVEGGYGHWCPACQEMHIFRLPQLFDQRPAWSFDHCIEAPSFSPSMNIHHPEKIMDGQVIPAFRCHYWLTAGNLHYDNDSTHALRGQVVPLPDIPG